MRNLGGEKSEAAISTRLLPNCVGQGRRAAVFYLQESHEVRYGMVN